MIPLTASKLGHAMACAWPFRPDVTLPPEGPSHPSALTGRAFASLRAHHIDPSRPIEVELGADEARARALFAVWRAWYAALGVVRPRDWATERPFAIDPATGAARVLPAGGQRDYRAARPGEITGTADLVAVDGDAVHVIDDKTGRPEYVDPPRDNWQLRTLALAAARVAGVDDAIVGLVFVSEEGCTHDAAHFDALDLDTIEAELRALVARIPTAEATPCDYCRFCPARTVCPAFAAAATQVSETAPAALAAVAQGNGALTADRVAAAWPQLRLLEAGVAQIKDAVRAYVAEHGAVPLANGKALRVVESTRSTLSASSIRGALGAGPGGEVIAMLERAGAVTTSSSSSLREGKR